MPLKGHSSVLPWAEDPGCSPAPTAAAMYTLIGTAKLNDVDPQAWLADVLARIAGTPQSRLHELLPWNWRDDWQLDQHV